jgi:hypothetical protein
MIGQSGGAALRPDRSPEEATGEHLLKDREWAAVYPTAVLANGDPTQ